MNTKLAGIIAALLLIFLIATGTTRGQYDQRSRERLLEQWYAQLNGQYFNDRLPRGVVVAYEQGLLGRGRAAESSIISGTVLIRLDDNLVPFSSVSMLLVAHETCHVALWNVPQPQGEHGREFQTCMRSLARAGAFEGVW